MPWQMSYAALNDSDGSELQTDVMRFMAILAFCLVAIFAIVRSFPEPVTAIPTESAVSPDTVAVELPETGPVSPVAASAPPAPIKPVPERDLEIARLPAPAPARQVRPADRTAVILRTLPPRTKAPVAEPVRLVQLPPLVQPVQPEHPAPATVAGSQSPVDLTDTTPGNAPAEQGLSLRFESDAVLNSLVARGLIALYAVDDGQFYRMTVRDERLNFEAASAPAQYHEMFVDTVPLSVTDHYSAQFRRPASSVVWGVTLPASTTRQLQRFVQTHFSGGLIITAQASLALASES